ncbi:MAG: mannose-1-phosphate guanylyltransferase [Chitinophagaceae bacterium]|nr:mannose-1-phosphate guanylyltransferase [Chitinophagaceae bacterium]
MSIQNNYVAIMAGGIGSRFWPISRTDYPKQFLDILGTGQSLLQWTYRRFKDICPPENIYFITNHSYAPLIKEQIPEILDHQIVSEPSRKNTAACAVYFAHKIHALNPNANIIMSPADHLILDELAFRQSMFDGLDFVKNNASLLTLGIKPTRPDTGYGYIQYDQTKSIDQVFKVKTFTEKPNLEIARAFLKSGDFLWNAGIFLWTVQTIITAFAKYEQEMDDLFKNLKHYNTDEEYHEIEKTYPLCTNTSIDYAVMEKADNVFVAPAQFGWSDLGTWESAYENSEKDYLGNAVHGKNVIIIDAAECMVKAPDKKLVLLQGLEKFIVIDTPDVLMICERANEQHIKEYVADIKRNKGEKFL